MLFKNYLKIALRNMVKQKGYTLINVFGLAVGIACCILILMFVNDELSYDSYNKKVDRIYRVVGSFKYGGRDFSLATLPAPLAKVLVDEYPEVENAVRFMDKGSFVVSLGDKHFKESKIIFSDPSIFQVFTIPLLEGDPQAALKKTHSIVLSKKAAEKYFGQENPVGKTLRLDKKEDYLVTAVFQQIPHASHFHFDFIASFASLEESSSTLWLNNSIYTYVLLKKHAGASTLEAKFPGLIKKHLGPQVEKHMGKSLESLESSGNLRVFYYLQPLGDIHLHSNLMGELEPNSDIKYVYIFSALALFILLLASINFMNLSTARSIGRTKEVGIRKYLGSLRSQLVKQFLSESMIFSVISMLFALVLINLVLPFFSSLSGKELTPAHCFNGKMLLIIGMITLGTGILAGGYPAVFISAFRPVNILKGQVKVGGKSTRLRGSLVVFQFTTSIVLIIGTLVVGSQIRYIQNKKLGFDKQQVLILNNAYLLDKQVEAFKNEVLKNPQVAYGTISGFLPVPSSRKTTAVFPEGQLANKNSTAMQHWEVDHDYLKTLGMKIKEGRDFSRDFSTDELAVVINEAAAKQFNWDEPVGKRISMTTCAATGFRTFKVIGVVENFNFESLKNSIGPVVMFLGNNNDLISFRLSTDHISEVIGFIKDNWNKFLPGQPFNYSFLDERFAEVYRAEQRIGKLFGSFALLAILVSCLGLLGLAAFTVEQRKKEIGIRKVLGASVSSIVHLLSREFVILVGIANLIAWPVAYMVMNKWLQEFAYRTRLSVWIFLVAGLSAVIIALLTVTYQVVKAGLTDPVKTIKYQ